MDYNRASKALFKALEGRLGWDRPRIGAKIGFSKTQIDNAMSGGTRKMGGDKLVGLMLLVAEECGPSAVEEVVRDWMRQHPEPKE